jgi:hypothetical protein
MISGNRSQKNIQLLRQYSCKMRRNKMTAVRKLHVAFGFIARYIKLDIEVVQKHIYTLNMNVISEKHGDGAEL